jgi:hypothetical protein
MSYLEPWDNKSEPPYLRGITNEEFPRTNFANREFPVKVQNARPQKQDFNLDTHGFAFHEDDIISAAVVEAVREKNKAMIEDKYYPQVERLVKKETGATRVIIFDHTYRKRDTTLGVNENPNGREQPATLVSHHSRHERRQSINVTKGALRSV